jgi:hypothetical protein
VLVHGLEPPIYLILPHDCCAPAHEVVLEDSFVELVKNIGCEAGKDVGVWEIGPKWFVNRT